jgi:hypothetical protein
MAKQEQRSRSATKESLFCDCERAVQTPAMSDISHPSAIHGRPDQLLCDVRNLRGVLVVQSQPLTLNTKITKIAAPGSPHGLLVHAERRRLQWAISRPRQFASLSPNAHVDCKHSVVCCACCWAAKHLTICRARPVHLAQTLLGQAKQRIVISSSSKHPHLSISRHGTRSRLSLCL